MKKMYFLAFSLFLAGSATCQTNQNWSASGNGSAFAELQSSTGLVPQSPCNNGPRENRIDFVNDPEQGPVYRFYAGKNDGNYTSNNCNPSSNQKRARNEIRYDVAVPISTNQKVQYKWKMKLPSDFKVASQNYNFCHLHQLKYKNGSDSGEPLFTLTAYSFEGRDYLSVIHTKADYSSIDRLKDEDLNKFKGKWLEIEEVITYTASNTLGKYGMQIKDASTGEVLLEYLNNSGIQTRKLGTWGTSMQHKWGIYRTKPVPNDLQDEVVFLDDFEINYFTDNNPIAFECAGATSNPQPNWKDSYQAAGFCWCESTFDHDLDDITKVSFEINGTPRNIRTICDELKKHPNYRAFQNGDPVFNDIQCGNGPANTAIDETCCPGRTDMGTAGCDIKGPGWDIDWLKNRVIFGGTPPPPVSDNLALNRPTTQSSLYNNINATPSQIEEGEGGSASAVDGNTSGIWTGRSVTHTFLDELNPWWEVTLDKEENIGEIKIFNRTDNCCRDRLSNFTVLVIDNNGDTTFTKFFANYPDPSIVLDAGGALGRKVRITSVVTDALSLAEVEVYRGEATNPPATTEFEIVAFEDSYVRGSQYQNDNYGNGISLTLKNNLPSEEYTREVFLKFDLSQIQGTVKSAKLMMTVQSSIPTFNTASVSVYSVTDDSWTESGINWNNKPNSSALLDTKNGVPAFGNMEWDVTSFITNENNGNNLASLKVISNTPEGNNWAGFASSENSNADIRPVLIIEVEGEEGPQPVTEIFDGALISIQPESTMKYLSSENAELRLNRNFDCKPVVANKDVFGGTEEFEVEMLAGGKVAFKATVNDLYLCSEELFNTRDGRSMTATRHAKGSWEGFTFEHLGGETYALKANNGKYVTLSPSEQAIPSNIPCNDVAKYGDFDVQLFASGSSIGTAQRFILNVKNPTAQSNALMRGSDNSESTLGINQIDELKNNLVVYPNPANAAINFSLSSLYSNKDVTIVITDLMGREVYQQRYTNNDGIINGSISLSDFSDGIYIINAKTNNEQIAIKRFVKTTN